MEARRWSKVTYSGSLEEEGWYGGFNDTGHNAAGHEQGGRRSATMMLSILSATWNW